MTTFKHAVGADSDWIVDMLIPWAFVVFGGAFLVVGVIRFVRDRRRLSNAVLVVGGATLVLPGTMLLTANADGSARPWHYVIIIGGLGILLLGYPLLAAFLLVNGVTMLRKERRTLGHMLALLAGLAMVALPFVLIGLNRIETGAVGTVFVIGLTLVLCGASAYAGFCFFVFLLAAVAYRRLPKRFAAGHVIVLGAGLAGDQVPPLLASRLRTARAVADAQQPPAFLIPSGGQGPDEDLPEGEAMAKWLEADGVAAERIIVEDRSRTTRENLIYSRALLPSPRTQAIVVTTSYHVFRAALLTKQLRMRAVVVGAPTAAYYVPSAFLREWVAVMRENLWLHIAVLGLGVLIVGAGVTVSLTDFRL